MSVAPVAARSGWSPFHAAAKRPCSTAAPDPSAPSAHTVPARTIARHALLRSRLASARCRSRTHPASACALTLGVVLHLLDQVE